MKKLFSLFVVAFMAMSMMAVDWSSFSFLGDGAGGGAYTDKYKVSGASAVNIQHPEGLATADGIYITFGDAAFNKLLDGERELAFDQQGAGIWLHLSNFTALETEVNVYNNESLRWTFYVYYADGAATGEVTHYYLKHPWRDGASSSWTWKELAKNGTVYTLVDYYGGAGADWNTAAEEVTPSGSQYISEPTLEGEPTTGDLCKFTFDPSTTSLTITKVPVHNYCQTEIGHMLSETADQNSFVLLSVGKSDDTHMIVRIDQDRAKNSKLFDYLSVAGHEVGADSNTDGKAALAVEFDLPTPDEYGQTNYTILWSYYGWGGRWQADLTCIPVNGTCEYAVIPVEKSYYIKNSWNEGSDWTWKALTRTVGTTEYTITATYGGGGCNIADNEEGTGNTYFAENDANIRLVGAPAAGDVCVFTYDPQTGVLTIMNTVIHSAYCQIEIGHLASETADPNSFVLLSVGSDGNGNTIVRIDQDAEKNSMKFDYLNVDGQATTGKTLPWGVESLGVSFPTPTADAEGNITLTIMWSTAGWDGNWMVQNIKVPATSTCVNAVAAPLEYQTINFINKPEWTSVACYTRAQGEIDNPNAAGVATAKTEQTINGWEIWTIDVPADAYVCRFIGNDNAKSNDLYVRDGYYYTTTSYWSADSVQMVMTGAYLLGLDAEWKATEERNLVDPIKVKLDANADGYPFKVLDHGEWMGFSGEVNADNNERLFATGTDNCVFKTVGTLPTYYTIEYDQETKIVSVVYPDVYYIKHPWAGGNWAWVEMAMNEDGTYSYEGQYGAAGCNYSTDTNAADPAYLSEGNGLTLIGQPQTGDYCIFVLDPVAGAITVTRNENGWATGCDEVEATKAQKIVRDGKIVIIKNGVEYSVLGARL